jgi:hypothetical protein
MAIAQLAVHDVKLADNAVDLALQGDNHGSAVTDDTLEEAGVLDENARSVGIALDKLAAVRERFLRAYRAMLSQVMDKKLPTAVCTIYEARFPDADLRRRGAAALTLLNECITREAFARDLTLIDLRLICDSDADFANPIARRAAQKSHAPLRNLQPAPARAQP